MNKQTNEVKDIIAYLGNNPNPPKSYFFEGDGELSVIKTFLYLTLRTTPNPLKAHHWDFMKMLGVDGGVEKDGNIIAYVGKNPTTMFTSHVDTADNSLTGVNVRHIIKLNGSDDVIVGSNNATLIGADDKAGVAIMLYMYFKGVPGLYYFFRGEESGRKGSSASSKSWNFSRYKRCISFDRMGYKSIITHQSGRRSCSDNFATQLAKQYHGLGITTLDLDSGGSFTDSYSYFDSIPECTNISVGYFAQHTSSEIQNLSFLERLAKASASVKWSKLPYDDKLLDKREYDKYKSKFTTTYAPLDTNQIISALKEGKLSIDMLDSYVNDNVDAAVEMLYLSLHNLPIEPFVIDGKKLEIDDFVTDGKNVFVIDDIDEYDIVLTDVDSGVPITMTTTRFSGQYKLATLENLDAILG